MDGNAGDGHMGPSLRVPCLTGGVNLHFPISHFPNSKFQPPACIIRPEPVVYSHDDEPLCTYLDLGILVAQRHGGSRSGMQTRIVKVSTHTSETTGLLPLRSGLFLWMTAPR
jgi:hypothetical protein